ncbi:MAG: toll/interleukin-1 receptor domain-containing protein [Nitrospira sp.]|nr:toll/interleukin-1 receptor domain-containing protein [Nitrospira sp.]
MSKILISYRREDSADVTGRIYDRLIQVFPQSVFRDVDSIPLGVDFRTYLDEQVGKCDVFLAVIGPDWMGPKDSQGKTRLEDPRDFVRIEIESALKRRIPVIPVLVRGASMPSAKNLPDSMQALTMRNSAIVRSGPDFHHDMDQLIEFLKYYQISDLSERDKVKAIGSVFISYAREDQGRAEQLARAIEQEGWQVWWDFKIHPGEDFDEAIAEALKKSSCVLVLWSERAISSKYVKDEAREALEHSKLVPVFIENVRAPLGLRAIQGVNLTDWTGSRDDPYYQLIVKGLERFRPKLA